MEKKYLAVACRMPAAFDCRYPHCECGAYDVTNFPHVPVSREEFEKHRREQIHKFSPICKCVQCLSIIMKNREA